MTPVFAGIVVGLGISAALARVVADKGKPATSVLRKRMDAAEARFLPKRFKIISSV